MKWCLDISNICLNIISLLLLKLPIYTKDGMLVVASILFSLCCVRGGYHIFAWILSLSPSFMLEPGSFQCNFVGLHWKCKIQGSPFICMITVAIFMAESQRVLRMYQDCKMQQHTDKRWQLPFGEEFRRYLYLWWPIDQKVQ